MKTVIKLPFIKSALLAVAALFFMQLGSAHAQGKAAKKPAKNIVIVHGAFADGSGWRAVYDILTRHNYNVSIVQNPLTSLADDVRSTNSVLDKQKGDVVLVGHSWGGMVITEAGVHPKVASLVYVAAFAPDKGESAGAIESIHPLTDAAGFTAPDKQGYVYFELAKFHSGFAGGLSQEESDFLCKSQAPIQGKCFDETVNQVAWKTKPSYGVVALEDEAISPITERDMYNRAGAKITEVKGSHLSFITHAEQVAQVIMDAAEGK